MEKYTYLFTIYTKITHEKVYLFICKILYNMFFYIFFIILPLCDYTSQIHHYLSNIL